MSKLLKLAMPFAHYLGLAAASAPRAAAEDNERDQRDDESDEDYAKRMEKMDDEEEKARKAEEEKEKEAKRAKRAKADDEDDSDADMEEDEDDDEEASARAGRAQGARQRERIRCARIVAAGIKTGRVNQACSFAFDTKLSAYQAVAALNAAALDAPQRGAGLRERMSAVQTPNPGANSGASAPTNPAAAAAARIVAAGERMRGGR